MVPKTFRDKDLRHHNSFVLDPRLDILTNRSVIVIYAYVIKIAKKHRVAFNILLKKKSFKLLQTFHQNLHSQNW